VKSEEAGTVEPKDFDYRGPYESGRRTCLVGGTWGRVTSTPDPGV
jgi:hypothetical protein